MKKIYFLFALLLVSSMALGQQFSWVKSTIEPSHHHSASLAAKQNLVVITGRYSDPTSFPAAGHFNLMVNDTAGSQLWSKNFHGGTLGFSLDDFTPAVTIDNNRNVIIAGSYRSFFSFDNTLLTNPGTGSVMYLIKFNATGVLQWEKQSVFITGQRVTSVNNGSDASGNIYVTGLFTGTLTIGTTSVTTSANQDGFVAKFDSNGNLTWLKRVESTNNENNLYSEIGSDGTVYLALVNSTGGPSTLLLKSLDSNGTTRWSKTISSAGKTTLDIAVDDNRNIYLTGNYIHSIDFTNTISLTSILNYKTFLAKFDTNGNCKWAKDLLTGNNYNSYPPSICFTADKALVIASAYNGVADFNNIPIPSAPAREINAFIIKADTSGAFLWTTTVPSGANGQNEANGISSDANNNIYISGNIVGNANFNGSVQNAIIPRKFLAKISATGGSLVTGKAFIDSNLNGLQEANESGLRGIFISTTSNLSTNITGPDGSYSLLLPKGEFSIVASPKKYHVVNPASITISNLGPSREFNNKNFAFKITPNKTDVAITLTNQTAARPGFNFSYHLSFKNDGTTTASDTITLQYDPNILTNFSSLTTPVSNVNGEIKWAYSNLQPSESRNITAQFSIPVTISLGTVFYANTKIKPILTDEFPSDNYDSTRLVVTGSYDPNDKQVNKPEISPEAATVGEYLDYTIRFQNTGTDTAFTVVVADQIAASLQVNTLEMLGSSHPYTLRLLKNNLFEWHFNNILLPDSNRNEPGSHGFIRFRIKTKPGLALGDSVRNNAAIYFDFNAPVITNYAVTKVVDPNEGKPGKNDFQVKLYPNPARTYVFVTTTFQKKTPVTVSLVNMLGQPISKTALPAATQFKYKLSLKDLPKGIYIVQLETETGRQTQRLVIQ